MCQYIPFPYLVLFIVVYILTIITVVFLPIIGLGLRDLIMFTILDPSCIFSYNRPRIKGSDYAYYIRS